jgi:high-affinity iron transporter
MLQAFVITVREGVEAFLIVAIMLAYLRKTGRGELARFVHLGIAVAIALSVGAGFLLGRVANQPLWEAALAMVAAVAVGSLTVHMWVAGKRLRREIEQGLGRRAARAGAAAGLGIFAFTVLMIAREGMETALLFGTLLFQVKSSSAVAGAALGLAGAGAVAWLWARHGHRVNLARFMQVTAIFLLLFVAQLFVYGFHELTEAGVLPNSEALHRATEPYGPDGQYGRGLNVLLVAAPLAWLAVSSVRRDHRPPSGGRRV